MFLTQGHRVPKVYSVPGSTHPRRSLKPTSALLLPSRLSCRESPHFFANALCGPPNRVLAQSQSQSKNRQTCAHFSEASALFQGLLSCLMRRREMEYCEVACYQREISFLVDLHRKNEIVVQQPTAQLAPSASAFPRKVNLKPIYLLLVLCFYFPLPLSA